MRAIAAGLIIVLALSGAASAETIKLKNGDKLENVTVVEKDDERVVLDHPLLGRIELPASEIKVPEPKKKRPGLFGTGFLEGWTKAISAGFTGSSGVTEENSFNTGLELKNETEHHRDNFLARYFYADANSSKTKSEFLATHNHDFLIQGSKFFAFLSGGYKYDEFQLWDHRFTGNGGLGYDFLREETYTLSGRAGPGFTVTRGGNDDREDLSALVGLNGTWTIVDGVSFNGDTSYYPVLQDLPKFRWLTLAELKIAVGIIEGLSFKLGGSYEYDSQNAERNDRKYYGNLVYDF